MLGDSCLHECLDGVIAKLFEHVGELMVVRTYVSVDKRIERHCEG